MTPSPQTSTTVEREPDTKIFGPITGGEETDQETLVFVLCVSEGSSDIRSFWAKSIIDVPYFKELLFEGTEGVYNLSFTGPAKGTLERSESSTTFVGFTVEIEQKLKLLFQTGKEYVFEDGIDSQFSNELVRMIEMHDNSAVFSLARLIVSENVNKEVASEALRWLGRIQEPASYTNRLLLLERCLFSSSAKIRDGAILGLASMNNSNALTHIKEASKRETIPELRANMEQVISQLEGSLHALPLKEDKTK